VNITLRLKDETLETAFVKEASERGLIELAGHRSVGGIRVSLYNAMEMEGVELLSIFMKEFLAKYQ